MPRKGSATAHQRIDDHEKLCRIMQKQTCQKIEELHQQILKLGLEDNVVFTGKLTPVEIAKLYRSADIMLNPTTVDNMPNSILEAMASGVPVVTTDVGGIPYIVKDGETALMTKVNDAESMATQISRLLNDPLLCEALSSNGLQQVQQYTWAEVKCQWLALYRSFAGYPSKMEFRGE